MPHDQLTDERQGYAQRDIVRHQGDSATPDQDFVAEEFPVALVYNGISHAVMMATPCDLEEFAIGFTLTEGIVDSAADIFDLELLMHADSAEIQLTIAQPALLKLKDQRRTLAGRTGCGVCGIESIELLDLKPEKVTQQRRVTASAAVIERAARELMPHQTLMQKTGGVHAAAWCSPDGEVLKVFEDVGRHNGLDKLIGHLARKKVDMQSGFIFLSSRASYELVRKSARLNIPMVATISAPTTLAISIAREAGMTLVSFCRRNGFVEYTDNKRIID